MTASATATSSSQSVYQSLTAATAKGKANANEESQSRFLTLLTTQLKNQDPTNPADSAQMTSQLAQISTVDGITRLNTTLQGLVASQQSGQALQAAALVGHGVLVDGNQLSLSSNDSGSFAVGGFTLDGAADTVTISIKDANGLEVATETMTDQQAGSQEFIWDGTTTSGAVAADGKYTISVTATKGKSAVTASALEMATVISVSNSDSGVTMNAGRFNNLSLSDIRRII
ncbi:MAG TPA: flagellar hook assembly protein FlgD [Rhodocyclaceae bacterium]|nr:flagellar hook assembly protein FlgD [Rhodocyclaceae bacterium]